MLLNLHGIMIFSAVTTLYSASPSLPSPYFPFLPFSPYFPFFSFLFLSYQLLKTEVIKRIIGSAFIPNILFLTTIVTLYLTTIVTLYLTTIVTLFLTTIVTQRLPTAGTKIK